MQKIIGSLLFLLCVLNGCSQNKNVEDKRLKITQTAVMLTLTNEILRKDTLIDSVFIITTKKIKDIRIVQLPVYPFDVVDNKPIDRPAVLDYFVYSSSFPNGLYFKKLQGLASFVYSVDSVMKSKVDKYINIDTLSCLKEQPIIYNNKGKDLIYSYPNKQKVDENYDFDIVKFVYTDDEHLRNEYLSKLKSTIDGHFLYKVIFCFQQTFDKRINHTIPEREVKIEISESNNIDKEELEKVLAKYKMTFH